MLANAPVIATPAVQVLLTVSIVISTAIIAIGARLTRPDESTSSQPRKGPGSGTAATPPIIAAPASRIHLAFPYALAILAWLFVAGVLIWRGGDPVGIRPDSWSDANVLISGQNYAKEGFLKHWGAAQHQIISDTHSCDPYFLYTQYPVASNILNGLWQAAGVASTRAHRTLPAACSLAALALWFLIFRRATGGPLAAIAVAIMATCYGFFAYADNLHFHAYAMCTSAAAMYGYIRALAPETRRRWPWFALSALGMFVTAWFTWEYHLWMLAFLALYPLLFKTPVRLRWLPLMVLPLLFAVALQNVQRRLAFADVRVAAEHEQPQGFLADMYRRTIGFDEAVDTPSLPGGAKLSVATYPAWLAGRFTKFYGLPSLAALVLGLIVLFTSGGAPWRIRNWPGGPKLLLILTVASGGWWLVMMQHTSVHPHTMRQGLAAYALLLTLAASLCWRTFALRGAGRLLQIPALALLAALAFPHFEGLVTSIQLHTFQSRFNQETERGDSGKTEPARMGGLARVVPPNGVILTNQGRLPTMRYWSQRPVYNGGTTRYPDRESGRPLFELSFNHLRELYKDQLPPLYFAEARLVQLLSKASPEQIVRYDPWICFLMVGQFAPNDAQARVAAQRLTQLASQGRSADLFCPFVGSSDYLLVFDLGPAVPVLRQLWGRAGYPSLSEFGPPR